MKGIKKKKVIWPQKMKERSKHHACKMDKNKKQNHYLVKVSCFVSCFYIN
jgi:hypothetical protein